MQRPSKEEEEETTDSMRRPSCKEELDAGTCKESSSDEEASETVEELKGQIEDLKAKVAFLSFWSPTDHHSQGHGLTDVVLVAADDDGPNGGPSMVVPAHKDVLGSRSPVFKAMLENEMEERRSGIIKISDMSYDALRAFVDHLYAEEWLDEQMACELLVLAEKYQVEHLKAYCEKFLVSKLNWDNSIKNYAFAHQQNAKLLLEAALSLFLDDMEKLENHQDYWEFCNKDPYPMLKIYRAYLQSCSIGNHKSVGF